jgi:hypothetical protein
MEWVGRARGSESVQHEALMTYGLYDGALHHVGQVNRGLACNRVCHFCGGTLIARRGDVRAPYLAHLGFWRRRALHLRYG